MEKFRHVFGKIPMNFFMLTPRIFCFTGDGGNLGKIPRSILFQRIFPRNFLVQTELFAWRDAT
jgi:hypothetical protein